LNRRNPLRLLLPCWKKIALPFPRKSGTTSFLRRQEPLDILIIPVSTGLTVTAEISVTPVLLQDNIISAGFVKAVILIAMTLSRNSAPYLKNHLMSVVDVNANLPVPWKNIFTVLLLLMPSIGIPWLNHVPASPSQKHRSGTWIPSFPL